MFYQMFYLFWAQAQRSMLDRYVKMGKTLGKTNRKGALKWQR